MEGIDEHKHTRFPCLATARYVVAAVVSVLTVVVVVMVTIVALRPEEIIFSITHQYIQADRRWWVSSNNSMSPETSTSTSTTTLGDINSPPGLGGSTETTTYSAVRYLYIWVSLTADNPGGRADISGEDVTIRVLDMPNWSSPHSYFFFQGLNEIVTYELQDERFSLERHTSHTLGKWVLVNNTRAMFNLANRYGGRTSFTAMVQVSASIVTRKGGQPKSQNYYCWPVIVGLDDPSGGGYAKSASCRSEKEMDSPVPFSAPAPAPAADAR